MDFQLSLEGYSTTIYASQKTQGSLSLETWRVPFEVVELSNKQIVQSQEFLTVTLKFMTQVLWLIFFFHVLWSQ